MDFFTHVTALASLAVVAVQQILKLNFVPMGFANRHPVPTNILLSIAAAIIAAWKTSVAPHSWTDWVLLIATVSVVAAIVYNSTLRNWAQLRSTEGEGN